MTTFTNQGSAINANEIGSFITICNYNQTSTGPDPNPEVQKDDIPIVCKRPNGIVSTYMNRDHLQTEIRNALRHPQSPNVKFSFSLVNLHGIGGNGKSQLAKKIFSLSESDQDFNGNLIWMDAGKEDMLYKQFVSLVLTEKNVVNSVYDIARLFYTKHLKNQEFLIIFDNVVDFTMIEEYLPVNGINTNAKVLLTSKKPWDVGEKGTIHNILVGVFHPNEARAYVSQFTKSITEAQLAEICSTTSRIPADLSLICHSYRYLKEELTESYSWEQHLKHYGKILSTEEVPKDHLPGVEGVDYSISTKRNLALSLNLLESISKFNAGHFSVFILKNFAFCYGQEISRNEFAHRVPALRLSSDLFQLAGSVETKINYGLNVLKRFGFIEALDQQDDVMYHIHQSYQCALQILMLERREKRSRLRRRTYDEWKDILMGLIEWAQLDEPFHDAFVSQKFIHMSCLWVYIDKEPELLKATIKTRHFLMCLCASSDYDCIKLFKKYAKRNFVALLLDNMHEDKSIYYCPALQRTTRQNDLSTLFELVLIVAAELNRIRKKKQASLISIKHVIRSITSKKSKSIQITEEYIHYKMLLIAFMSVDIPALEFIYTNFPLAFTLPLPTKNNRTLLQGFVMMTDMLEADAAVVAQLQAIVDLNERYNSIDGISVKEIFLNNKDDDGLTALHYAAIKGSAALVNVLLESGACAGIKDDNDFTPLDYAILEPGNLIKEMLSKRFDLVNSEDEIEDITKMCKLKMAYPESDYFDDDPYLQQAFIEYKEVASTLVTNYGNVVELILTKGSGIEKDTIQNALMRALMPRTLIKLDTIASLLLAGADANYEPPKYFRPLHSALRHTPPNLNVVRLLLDNGANPSLIDCVGKKPMFWLEQWLHSDNFTIYAKKDYDEMEKLLTDIKEE